MELDRRQKWGGILNGIPELTEPQRQQLRHHHRGQWVPPRALYAFWNTVDPAEESWSLKGLLTALAEDRIEIEALLADHREQTERLTKWRVDVERLGRERDVDDEIHLRRYYERLTDLGYHGERPSC